MIQNDNKLYNEQLQKIKDNSNLAKQQRKDYLE